ncbi:ATP-binding protein [Pricia sp. S334]|uniref:histidine kinase n=1 Tax=Pricia mediterranea TaxID=3076079 RepID=A0ABU3L2J9_9FLAO|nr:ATP-binding protein [Pricia sp. S334]MDT7827409.1 ATP-binding protein [Pricia sp. S334]
MNPNLPIPSNERERLQQLYEYQILNSDAEEMFDNLTRLAGQILDVPTALVTLVDEKRQWFKSKYGLEVDETPREISFCQYSIMSDEILEVPNTLEDERFKNNPMVLGGPEIRFYVGSPLTDKNNIAIGTLCAIDTVPRKLNDHQRKALRYISNTVLHLIKLRREKIEVEKLSMAKDEFLSNMSHEIRTPLNAVIGFNDLLKKTPLTKQQKEYLDTVQISSQNLKVIIDDILDISKLESGNVHLEKNPVSLRDLIQYVVRLQAPTAKEKGIKLLSSIDYEIPDYVVADETRLTQIFINLVGNAVKFTNEGSVELRAEATLLDCNKVMVEFIVKDTGIGIPEEKLETVFERFSQAEASTTRHYGGTGLGLNIVNMLIGLYGGAISVTSQLGQGSEFKFEKTFEITEMDKGQHMTTEKTGPNGNLFTDTKILLVEDNVHNQLLATHYFKRWGSKISIAENGRVGVEMLQNENYDVVLMDLQMPVMDGFQATTAIRKELGSNVPIIGCSAHSLVGEKERCLELGMNDYIAKPYSEEELIQTTLRYSQGKEGSSDTEKADKIHTVELSDIVYDDFESLIEELKMQEGDEFGELIQQHFQESTPSDIEDIEKAIENNDATLLFEKCHMLAGSLGVLGFSKGHGLSSSIEASVKKGDMEAAKHLAGNLIVYLNKALNELR